MVRGATGGLVVRQWVEAIICVRAQAALGRVFQQLNHRAWALAPVGQVLPWLVQCKHFVVQQCAQLARQAQLFVAALEIHGVSLCEQLAGMLIEAKRRKSHPNHGVQMRG